MSGTGNSPPQLEMALIRCGGLTPAGLWYTMLEVQSSMTSFESHSGSSAAFHPAGLVLATWVVSGKAPGSSGLSEPPALCSIAQQGPDHHI